MGPRNHPPTASHQQDAAAVLAYKEEIIVEVLQRKSEADALEEELRTATSRQKKPSENGHKAGLGLSSDDSLDDRDEVDKTELEHGSFWGKDRSPRFTGLVAAASSHQKFRNLARQEQLDSFGRETRILRMMNRVGIARFCGIHTDLPNLSFLLECVDGSSIHEICHADKERPLQKGGHGTVSAALSGHILRTRVASFTATSNRPTSWFHPKAWSNSSTWPCT